MKVVMFSFGTRGDLQPLCVLGYELKKRGHHVRIIAEEKLKYVVDMFELEYFNLPGDSISALLDKNNDWLAKGKLDDLVNARIQLDRNTPGRLESFYKGSIGMDLIITSLCTSEAQAIKEKLGIPYVPLYLQPYLPTSQFPHLFISHTNLYFSFLNRLTYTLAAKVVCKFEVERIEPLRHLLWLPKWEKGSSEPFACVYDPEQDHIIAFDERFMIPKWGNKFGTRPEDYPERYHMTGFLFPSFGDKYLDPRVESFIKESPKPPILFGLSSIPAPDPEKTYEMVKEVVVNRLGRRLIYVKSWTTMDDSKLANDNVLFVQNIDPETVYSKLDVIIHHGGVGSMASAFRSGTPTLVTPLYYDQPFWAARVVESGSGLSVPFSQLNEQILLEKLDKLLNDQSYKQKALDIAKYINERNPNTIDHCISVIDKVYLKRQQQLENEKQE